MVKKKLDLNRQSSIYFSCCETKISKSTKNNKKSNNKLILFYVLYYYIQNSTGTLVDDYVLMYFQNRLIFASALSYFIRKRIFKIYRSA